MKYRIAAAVAAVGLLAACSNGVRPGGAGTTPSASPSGPRRIVSISPSATEMLFAIGAGPQVVAVDDNSNYPPEAPHTDLSGFQPSVEAISKHQPDLVVLAIDTSKIKAQLEKLAIPVLLLPAANTLDDVYAQIDQLGQRTGHVVEATRVVDGMKRRIAELTKEVPARAKPLTYFHELDKTLFTATSKTFVGQVYTLAGLKNIADPADKTGGGYPQLSAEYVVKANPDLIFLADTKCCGQTAKTVAARPGFARVGAVRNGRVVELDDDIASRWGPRVVEFLQRVVEAVKAVPTT